MDKLALIDSASRLKEISTLAANVFESIVEVCAQELNVAMRREPDLEDLIGEGNTEVMETNHGNHFSYMSATAALFDAKSFVETVIWVLRTYRARGFSVRYWNVMLPKATEILGRHLPPVHFAEVRPFYDWLEHNMRTFAQLSNVEDSVFERMGGLHGHDK